MSVGEFSRSNTLEDVTLLLLESGCSNLHPSRRPKEAIPRDQWLFYCNRETRLSKSREAGNSSETYRLSSPAGLSIMANASALKGKNTLSQLCYCSADVVPHLVFFSPSSLSCCTDFLALANISLLSHLSSPPALSLSRRLSLSIFPSPLVSPPRPYNQCGF